ncbi:TRAP transporter permease [Marinicrinis lubricantis]|uniref:TRAP transporter permease n=1 Tax=Marinicrinis lubricantis TaxID=2086470 RepID=A0ABW1IP42_9BACL
MADTTTPAEATIQRKIDELEGSDRNLKGFWALLALILAAAMSIFHLYTAGFGMLPEQGVVHITFALVLVFVIYPYRKGTGQRSIPWYDLIIAAAALFVGIYMFTQFKDMALRSGNPNEMDTLVAFLIVGLVLEATRRVLGLPLMILALIFIIYGLIGYRTTPWLDGIIPEAIIHAGYDLTTLVTKLNTNLGIFGTPIYVSSTYVFIFILFGAFFDVTGAGRMFINTALSLLGPFRGGPAKAAVLASGAMGSISGSSVANVVTTGTFTIPLMKKVGFKSKTAGGIEVAASSSGQLMPPIMGAAAFIMAETTGIPYWDIARSALIPSLLAYTAILVMVHLEALKRNIRGIPKGELIPVREVLLNKGFLIFPIGGLIYYLSQGNTPTKAAYMAVIMILFMAFFASSMIKRGKTGYALSLVVVAVAYLLHQFGLFGLFGIDRISFEYTIVGLICFAIAIIGVALRNRAKEKEPLQFGWRETLQALELGAKNGISVAVACAAAGILVGVVTMTGLGSNLSALILKLAGSDFFMGIDPLYPILVAAMIASMILGMGLPTTATYIVLAAVMAPPLVGVGLSLMAAHLFVFYYGILADDTPPINLPAYAAAGIAKSEPVQTGVQGFKYDSGALLLPFAFATNPYLLLMVEDASPWRTLWAIITALVGIIAFSSFIQNYFKRRYFWYERLAALCSALLLIHSQVMTDIIGIALLCGVLVSQLVIRDRRPMKGNAMDA